MATERKKIASDILNEKAILGLVQWKKQLTENRRMRMDMRNTFEEIDRDFARRVIENEQTAEARAKKATDVKASPELVIPVMKPQTRAALTYLKELFLTGYPIFGTVASPENQQYADMMDAFNAEHERKMGWKRNLGLCFLDGLKFNFMAAEVEWQRISGQSLRQSGSGFETKKYLWQGNQIKRLNPYNVFWDDMVPLPEVHIHGSHAGYVEIMTRTRLRTFLQDLPEENRMSLKQALEAADTQSLYYEPNITERTTMQKRGGEFDWMSWANAADAASKQQIQYKNAYEVVTMYGRIIPQDFDLRVPDRNMPQVWKFIYVNDVLVYAEKLSGAHNYLPIIFGQPTEDGLGLQTPSFSEDLTEIQQMSTSLWGAKMAIMRRMVGDRMIYDPRKIRPEDINNPSPISKIPIRPNSYGTDIRTAVFPIPFEGAANAASLLQDMFATIDFGRSLSGVNKPQEGQFIKGNRTLQEFDTIMSNSTSGLRDMALLVQDQFLTPIKEVLKYNIIQFGQAGQIYFAPKKAMVNVVPSQLIDAAMDFKLSDGLLPSAKIVNEQFLNVLWQQLQQNPVLQTRVDQFKLLAYLAGLNNIPDLESFAADQQVSTQQADALTADAVRKNLQPAGPGGPTQ